VSITNNILIASILLLVIVLSIPLIINLSVYAVVPENDQNSNPDQQVMLPNSHKHRSSHSNNKIINSL
jgi:hypothetical protein